MGRTRETSEARQRILETADRLFYQDGVRAAGIDRIIAEAGVAKMSLYKHFPSKDDLILAVMERGVAIVVSYLEHQMAKESQPRGKVVRWIEGTLAQVADPHLISMARAAAGQMSAGTSWRAADQAMMLPLRELLVEPVAALGSSDVERDVEAVFSCTASMMRRYVGSAEEPGPDDIAHVVRFCLRGLGAV